MDFFGMYRSKFDARNVLQNQETELANLDMLLNMDMSRIHITLPESCKYLVRYFLVHLTLDGCVGMYRDPDTGFLNILKMVPLGYPDMHGNYTAFQGVGENGYTIRLTADEVAVCWENLTRTNSAFLKIQGCAERLTDIQRTADARMINHKAPVIFKGPRTILSSIREFIRKVKNNEEFVLIDDGIRQGRESTDVKFDVAFINNDLIDYKQRVLGDYLQTRGINYNPESRKKERVLQDEVNANNNMIEIVREVSLTPILSWIEECKEKFGEECNDMKVYFHDDEGSDINDSVSDDQRSVTDADEGKQSESGRTETEGTNRES